MPQRWTKSFFWYKTVCLQHQIVTANEQNSEKETLRKIITVVDEDRVLDVECQCGVLLFEYFKAGIQPIIGAELSLDDDRCVVLLAQSQSGYGNLCRLVSLLQARPDREEALAHGLPLTDLAPHTGDLVALCNGEDAEALALYDLTASDRLEEHEGQEVTVAGVRLASQRFRANGEASMVLVDMEDRAGIYQVLWRGEALRRYREALSSREPVVVRGCVGADRQGLTLVLGREIQSVQS